MWRADVSAMPADLVTPPPELILEGAGLSPDATALDNNFVAFGGRAVVAWPEWHARLALTADPIYACLVVYTPAGQDLFRVEPATNCTDGFNLAANGQTDTGMIVLEPGATAVGTVTLTPTTGSAS